jgi:hypothetical protein
VDPRQEGKMELCIGMSRAGLRKLAKEILVQCDETNPAVAVEIVRYIEANGRGPEMTLLLSTDDMEDRDDVTEDTAYWEMDA